MKPRSGFFLLLIIVSVIAAAWQWLRPYQWGSAPEAAMKVAFSRIERDHGNYWLDVHLRVRGGMEHDLRKPVHLILPGNRELPPAQTTLEGRPGRPIEALSLKFWLESTDLDGPIDLKINDGTLQIRSGSGTPELENQQSRFHQTSRW